MENSDTQTRARQRLKDVLETPDPSGGLWAAVDDGYFTVWFPEVVQMRMEQDPIHKHKDVLTHTIAVTAKTPPIFRVRLGALLHDVGKPATRRIGPDGVTFRHHEAVGARLTLQRLADMGFDQQFVDDVAQIVDLSGRFKGYEHGWSDSAVRRYARDAGPLLGDLNTLVRCDCTSRNPRKSENIGLHMDDLERRIRELAVADAAARERPPLSGDDIMALLDVAPGRHIGQVLGALLAHHRADGPLDATEAEAFVRQWWATNVTA